jgi:Fe-S cluster assembly iron-binding protein IscA
MAGDDSSAVCRAGSTTNSQVRRNAMLEVTSSAAGQLRAALVESREGDQECFRVLLRENCLEVIPDQPKGEDVAVEHEGEVLLVMDRDTADRLSGHKLDYDENVSRLVFI